MVITIKRHLEELQVIEDAKSRGESRQVPTVRDLAKAIDVHETTLYDLTNNQKRFLNLEVASAIITEMRKRGFNTKVSDIIDYVPTEDLEAEPVLEVA